MHADELNAIKEHRSAKRQGKLLPAPDADVELTFAGDPKTHLTHEQHVERGLIVERAKDDPNDKGAAEDNYGCLGPCVFAQLDYVDMQHLFVVPWGHAALLGVWKDLISMIVDGLGSPERVTPPTVVGGKEKRVPIYKLSTTQKNLVKARANDITCTTDIGRAHRCIITKKGNNTMEDWLHFLEWGCLSAFEGGEPLQPSLQPS
jgi:hypothetical protein